MTKDLNIIGIPGSLRAQSHSRTVLRSMADLLPAGARYSELDIGLLPHYNEDLDGDAAPEAVHAAREAIRRANAVLLVTPEFNHGIPGVLKNTL
ncbi:NAD(P)H-dependent oxidoreductase, partial [Thioclava sp. BHET1]